MTGVRDLEGKTALVTGASRGLGRAMAERLALAGALVAVNYTSNREAAEETVSRIAAAGGESFVVQATLGGQAEASKLSAALSEELQRRRASKRLDILVNNVGGGGYAPILEVDEASYDHMMQNNVRGGFFLVQALHEQLADNGRVINISSAGARLTDPGIITYTMAKAAVDAFTRALAAELGPRGITVNAVSPGFTAGHTNDYIALDAAAARPIVDATALRRFGQPEEIADIVYALASPSGRWVTAQIIEASGGFKL